MNASVKLLELVLPSAVALQTRVPESHPSSQLLGTERSGSGILIEPGLLLTVNYVLLGAQEIEVSTADDRQLAGRIVAQDFASGLGVVAIEDKQLPGLGMRNSQEAHIGQEIFLLGAAAQNTRRVHDGAISSLEPFDAHWEYSLDRGITTTAMNPGYGGGAIIDLTGKLLGIVSLDLNEVGRFTLGIPVDDFMAHRDELLQHGRRVSRSPRAWVGFICYNLNEHVVIAAILPGTPGDIAGLRPGDVVLTVDDKRISGRRDLYAQLWEHRAGEIINMRVFRDNEMKMITIESGDADRFFA